MSRPGPSDAGGLAARHLTVSYAGRAAIRDVSLEVRPGQRVGIVGPNGAGKSTLLKAVVGLLRPDGGQVTIAGRPARAARRQVAYLPQRQHVDWDYPAQVRDVVAMGRYPHRGAVGRLRTDDRAAVATALERVGMTDLAQVHISELSGGQQQRTFLARAFAQGADVLLLDEPYVGIDAVTAKLIDGWLAEAAQDGLAIGVVDHDLSGIRRRYDEVVLLNRHVVARGTPDEVLVPEVIVGAYGDGSVVVNSSASP